MGVWGGLHPLGGHLTTSEDVSDGSANGAVLFAFRGLEAVGTAGLPCGHGPPTSTVLLPGDPAVKKALFHTVIL